ncbi:MAG: hypothetical protein K2O98_08120, partial [Lachnospiraceae bacterium]|nr:hypothetical protein [Lachnospiraceae bacterium]
MFAVGASNHSFFADINTVGHECALNYRTGFDLDARHQYTVNDLGAFADLNTGKQDRVLNFTLNDTALGNEGALDTGLWSDVMRQSCRILCVDLPCRIFQNNIIVGM